MTDEDFYLPLPVRKVLPAMPLSPYNRPRCSVDLGGIPLDGILLGGIRKLKQCKRPLRTVIDHGTLLKELLDQSSAEWLLASVLLPRFADFTMSLLDEYTFINITGHVLYVDIPVKHEVVFRLSPSTINALVDYHSRLHRLCLWGFRRSLEEMTISLHPRVLENLEKDGSGEAGPPETVLVRDLVAEKLKSFRPVCPLTAGSRTMTCF